jgi:hypothetical protein
MRGTIVVDSLEVPPGTKPEIPEMLKNNLNKS